MALFFMKPPKSERAIRISDYYLYSTFSLTQQYFHNDLKFITLLLIKCPKVCLNIMKKKKLRIRSRKDSYCISILLSFFLIDSNPHKLFLHSHSQSADVLIIPLNFFLFFYFMFNFYLVRYVYDIFQFVQDLAQFSPNRLLP